MQIVAHEDDDLLFMNPDLEHAIDAGSCVRTIYVTAGDAGTHTFTGAIRLVTGGLQTVTVSAPNMAPASTTVDVTGQVSKLAFTAPDALNAGDTFNVTVSAADPLGRVTTYTYNARGWVVHHNTDLWRAAAPIDGVGSGMWPTGGAWLTLHLWDHYDYSNDRAFLAKAYPAMKGASQFFVDTLVE